MMKKVTLFIALILFGTLLLVGCTAAETPAPLVPEGAQAGDLIDLKACEFQYRSSETIYAAECGTLVVPERWDAESSQLIALPVVRIPASGENPAEPVFYLEGGPGQSNLAWAPPDWVLEEHDVVMVGYRGVDGTVKLSCPELGGRIKAHLGKDLFSDQARLEYSAATEQCADDLQEAGVDLSGYTIPDVIEDMEAARQVLGYDRINLFSVSYGTRVAQIYAYMHPANLHRVVQIGVNTPGHFLYDPAIMDQMVEYLSKLCAQNIGCSSRTSDFAQTMYDVNHNMPKNWLVFKIDPDTIRFATHTMFFDNPNMAMIFDVYLAAAEGDLSGMAMANAYSKMMFPVEEFVFGDTFSKGGTMEVDKYGGIESISLGESIMGAPWSEFGWPMAADWPIELISKDLREFQESDVEMLLINGTVDFSTPPNALDEARPYFHKAQMVLLPEFGHVSDVLNIQPAAFERLITSYYDSGVADDSLYVYEPLSFEPGLSLIAMARKVLAAMILLPTFLLLSVALIVYRNRRRNKVNSATVAK